MRKSVPLVISPKAPSKPSQTLCRIHKHRGSMRLGQEGIDFVSPPVERQRMRACFRRHHLLTAHGVYIDDVYDPRLSNAT